MTALAMKVREDVEGVEDNTANNYMQRSDHRHTPYNNLPPSPPQYSVSPLSMSFTGTRLTTNTTMPISEATFKPIMKVDQSLSTNVNSFSK